MKKALSLILVMVLLISALPMTVFAAGNPQSAAQTAPLGKGAGDLADTGISYGLWLGSTQVTDANMDDILNDGGKAQFDPLTNTLTLNNPKITGEHNDSTIFCSGFDLTVKGRYTMTAAQASNALTVFDHSLTLDGNFTFLAWSEAVEASHDINVEGGRVVARLVDSAYAQYYAFCSDAGNLIFGDDVKYFEAEITDTGRTSCAISYDTEGTVTVSPKLTLTEPEGGRFKEGACVYNEGSTQKWAKRVVLEDKPVYVVTGNTDWLGNWSPKIDQNVMQKNSQGKYEITIQDVPATPAGKNDAVKVVQYKRDETNWIGVGAKNYNYEFRLSAKGSVTVTYDPESGEISVTGSTVTDPVYTISYITAVGNGEGNWLNGQSWDPDASVNRMTKVKDGIYEIAYKDVPDGWQYQVKFAANGTWDINWGSEDDDTITFGSPLQAGYNGGNIYFDLDEESDVTLRLDLTKMDWKKKTGATYTVTAVPAGSTLTGDLTVTSKSNFFGTKSVSYHGDLPSQVTVEYYCDTDKYLFINGQYGVNYDPKVLQLNKDSNTTSRGKLTVFPITGGSSSLFNFNANNYNAMGNFAQTGGFYLVDEDGDPIPVVRLVFDVVGSGNTEVELDVEVQSCSPEDDPDSYTSYYKKDSSYYNGHNEISDMKNALTKDGAKIYTVFSPEGSPVQALILGDADIDDDVTIFDATAIQRHLAELPVAKFDKYAADADEDGDVTIFDATAIQRYLAQLPTNKNIGKPIV